MREPSSANCRISSTVAAMLISVSASIVRHAASAMRRMIFGALHIMAEALPGQRHPPAQTRHLPGIDIAPVLAQRPSRCHDLIVAVGCRIDVAPVLAQRPSWRHDLIAAIGGWIGVAPVLAQRPSRGHDL